MPDARIRSPSSAAAGDLTVRLAALRLATAVRTAAVLVAAVLVAAMPVSANAAEASYKHIGAATCASSVCHGKLAAGPAGHAGLNEYRLWLLQDRHSQAFRGLDSQLGRAIAAKLGLPSASTAKICLDCHADNVPVAQRGPKFQLTDGIGCEVCHGGAEKWIESHKSATHAANVANGMNPTESPTRRAEICLQCHLGSQDRFTTHTIMGAGHPRLRFELDTFSANQPAHFRPEDEGYIKRKGKIADVNYWLSGQLEGATRFLSMLQSSYFQPGGLAPELAFYDCYSCHHPVDVLRWTPQRAGAGVKPGTLRVQKQHLVMLEAVAETLESPAAASELVAATNELTRACQSDVASARAAANKLSAWLRARQGWAQRSYSRADTIALRKALLRYAATDRATDFLVAEQVWLGVQSLSYGLHDESHDKTIDTLYEVVKSSATFNPERFAEVSRSVQAQF